MYSFSENSGGKLPEQEALVFWFLLQQFLSLFLWYLWNCCSSMSEISHWGNLTFPWSKYIGFIRISFTNWYLWSFSQCDLLQDCSEQQSCTEFHMSLVHLLSLKFRTYKLQSVPFLENLQEFHLDLCSPRYCNYPHVSCLRMNSGRGWNPNLEGSYLLEYSESEAYFWTQCSPGFYIWSIKMSASENSPNLEYSECTKTYQF